MKTVQCRAAWQVDGFYFRLVFFSGEIESNHSETTRRSNTRINNRNNMAAAKETRNEPATQKLYPSLPDTLEFQGEFNYSIIPIQPPSSAVSYS